MKKIRAAIVGYGNIGKYVLEALEAAPDFEVAGVVRRNPNDIPDELKGYAVTDDITKLDKVDVAVLATPTRSVETYAKEILSLGINTVDSFDIHGGCHLCRMGSGKRLNRSCFVAGDRSERNYIYEFRTGHEHGTYRCRESHRRCKGGFVHDNPDGYRRSSSYGLYRSGRRI